MKQSTEKGLLYGIIIVLLGVCLGMGAWILFGQKKEATEKPTERPVVERQPTKDDTPKAKEKPEEVRMSLWGNIGDSEEVDFEMEGTTGYYSYRRKGQDSGQRTLQLSSYDKSTGKCIIDAYYNGNYIGKFDGIFNEIDVTDDEGEHHYGQSYGGKFISVKNIEIDFYLYAD